MERFDFWLQYQTGQQALIAAARRAGKAEPNPLPHPDDIRFDYVALEVRFLGAVDEEGRAREVHYQAVAPLAYEMAIYTGEDNRGPDKEGKGARLGIYMALYVVALMILPPRLHQPIAAFEPDIMANWRRGRRAWGESLKRRCDIVEVPFSHGPSKALPFPYEKLGIMS